jgi:hypothetical protein
VVPDDDRKEATRPRKLDQQAVAHRLDDTSAVFRDHRVGYNAVFAQNAGGACFVETHQSRIASHVGGHYR